GEAGHDLGGVRRGGGVEDGHWDDGQAGDGRGELRRHRVEAALLVEQVLHLCQLERLPVIADPVLRVQRTHAETLEVAGGRAEAGLRAAAAQERTVVAGLHAGLLQGPADPLDTSRRLRVREGAVTVDERGAPVVAGERGVDELAHRAAGRLLRAHAMSSRIVAFACPPASHIVWSPYRDPVRRMWWTRSVMMRAPEPPSGWPRAIAPPLGFTRSQSTPISCIHAIGTDAKASFTSYTSMSEALRPDFASAFCVAGIGAVSMMTGSVAASAAVWTRAMGVSPSSFALSSVMTSSIEAPSEICEEFPAVMTPSSRKTVLSLPRDSSVPPGRMPSSVRNSIAFPSLSRPWIGRIWSANRTAYVAARERAWGSGASWSRSVRLYQIG